MERIVGASVSTPNAGVGDQRAEPVRATTPRAATGAVLAAVLLGMIGDGLFRAPGLGANVLLWVIAALAATSFVARIRGHGPKANHWALAVPIVFFAGVFAWRDAGGLLFLNMVAMLSGFGMLALALGGWPKNVIRASVAELLVGGASVGVSGALGTPLLIGSDHALSDGGSRPRWRTATAIARGALIALPVLLVFGALLSSADPRFERIIATLFKIDFAQTVGHIVLAGFIAWVAAGYLRAAVVADHPLGVGAAWRAPRLSLGIAELATVLGLVDALFAVYVAIQLPHLFGGAARVRDVAALTVADYARGGFFELVTVAALVLPLLLSAAALVRSDEGHAWRVFRALAIGMLALVGMMIISALQRLTLYVATFGLSEDRVYATAIVIWLAIVLALFAATVLRRRNAGFAFAAIVAGWLVLGALDVADPQALIVRTNSERARRGASFDWEYATRLNADAVPGLVAALGRVDAVARCGIALKLQQVAREGGSELLTDSRSWNASRARAVAAARAVNARDILRACPAGARASR